MEALVALLKARKYTIASIESLTAGLFAANIGAIKGASEVLKGALITYQTSSKVEVLHVSKALITRYGVISKEVALAMSTQGRKMFKTDITVSFSGNAGPDRMENKPKGLVYMAIVFNKKEWIYECNFHGERNEIREQCCVFMKQEILRLLQDEKEK